MKIKQVILMLLALCVAAGLYFGSETTQEREAEVKDAADMVLVVKGVNSAKTIDLSGREFPKPVSMEHRGKNRDWFITKPVEYPADNAVVTGLINGIAASRIERRLSEKIDPAEFGLAPPWVRLDLTGDKGEKQTLLLGNLSPAGDYLYAQNEGAGEVWLLPSDVKKYLTRTLFDLRDKKVLDFVVNDVEAAELVNGSERIELKRKKTGSATNWEFADEERASPSDITDLLYRVHALRALELLDEGINLPLMGLEKPGKAIVLHIANGEKKSKIGILFGSGTPGRDEIYLRRLSGGPVMVIKADKVKDLFSGRRQLTERRPLVIDQDRAMGLDIKIGDEHLSFTKELKTWKQVKPPAGERGGEKARDLIHELAHIRWERILPPDRDYGFEKPVCEIMVIQKLDPMIKASEGHVHAATLVFAPQDPQTGLLPVRVAGQERIMGLPADFADRLPKAGASKAPDKQ